MPRILGSLLVLASLSVGCTDPPPPCDTLAEHLCAVSDEAFCATLTTKAKDQLNDSAKQDECRAVLEDTEKLREVLDGVKAATRFELKAEEPRPAKKAKKAKKGEKAKQAKQAQKAEKAKAKVPTTTPNAKSEKPTAKTSARPAPEAKRAGPKNTAPPVVK